jgi:small GTP-binding protein
MDWTSDEDEAEPESEEKSQTEEEDVKDEKEAKEGEEHHEQPTRIVKIVTVGSESIGKTAFLSVLVWGEFPELSDPCTVTTYSLVCPILGVDSTIQIHEIADEEKMRQFRIGNYRDSQIIFLCFALDSRQSFVDLTAKWIDEVNQCCPNGKIILFGMKSDLRETGNPNHVTDEEANAFVSEHQWETFIPISAISGEVPDEVLLAMIHVCEGIDWTRDIEDDEEKARDVKIIGVGNRDIGKSAFMRVLEGRTFYEVAQPSPIYFSTFHLNILGEPYRLEIKDTAGGDEMRHYRAPAYKDAQIIFLYFALNSRQSFLDLTAKWIDEVNQYCPNPKIILIGTRSDLRETGNPNHVTDEEANAFVNEHRLEAFIPCSVVTGEGLDQVFPAVAKAWESGNGKKYNDL